MLRSSVFRLFIWIALLSLSAGALIFEASHCPRWGMMWTAVASIYAVCKWLSYSRTPHRRTPLWRRVCYLFAWPGMDAVAFLDPRFKADKPKLGEWFFAAGKFMLGVIFLYVLARRVPASHPYWRGWVGMVGIIMCLHFGSFHLLSCLFRTMGVDARPLMDWPLTATRLTDYWSRRWNTAFRDLAHRFLFRPLSRRLGQKLALLVGFLASGVVHDLVISVPAGGGYGGPTLFFLIQRIGMYVERSRPGRRIGLGTGFRGWLFTIAFIVGPAPLLFHVPFVERIIVPFLRAIGAVG